jgi:hypothetical protein
VGVKAAGEVEECGKTERLARESNWKRWGCPEWREVGWPEGSMRERTVVRSWKFVQLEPWKIFFLSALYPSWVGKLVLSKRRRCLWGNPAMGKAIKFKSRRIR